ncbi:hypothetical protein Q7P37_009451 [Cladosporium fusiforme]
MASSPQGRRRFAPLGTSSGGKSGDADAGGAQQLRGIVFDMDGTLCEPQNYMFGEMRAALGITKQVDILDHVYALPTAEQQEEAHAKIQAVERAAMQKQVPQAGFMDCKFIPLGGGTSLPLYHPTNHPAFAPLSTPVEHLLKNHLPSHISAFTPIVTREFRPPKPSPAGILHIAEAWGVEVPSSNTPASTSPPPLPLIMVGDSIDDIIAGYDAGALTVLVKSAGKEELEMDERTHVVIERLDELIGLLEGGIVAR